MPKRNPQRLIAQLTELGQHLDMPQQGRTLEQWSMALYHEIQRKLAAGEAMPPPARKDVH
jgi:hypothetical protein